MANPSESTSTKICATNLDISTVESVLVKYFHVSNTIKSFDATEIGAGKGFLSVMAKVNIEWMNQDANVVIESNQG
jgi:hypothetical protein